MIDGIELSALGWMGIDGWGVWVGLLGRRFAMGMAFLLGLIEMRIPTTTTKRNSQIPTRDRKRICCIAY